MKTAVTSYVPEGPAKAHESGEKLGAVLVAIQNCACGPRRINAPLLSDLVKEAYVPGAAFRPFVAPLCYAPMRLVAEMSRVLERYFMM